MRNLLVAYLSQEVPMAIDDAAVRREVVLPVDRETAWEALSAPKRPSVTASQLAQELPITRQAIAKHLATLAEAGLVSAAHRGRETRYRLTPEPLTGAMNWMARAGARWDDRLARLARRLEEA